MNRKNEPQSFEVTEYSNPEFGIHDAQKVILQIFKDIARDMPAHAVWGEVSGDQLKICYHSYEMHLPVRMKQVKEEANTILKETASHLKKEFKARTGQALNLKMEMPLSDQADRNYTSQKVSLNERYYYNAWRVFTINF